LFFLNMPALKLIIGAYTSPSNEAGLSKFANVFSAKSASCNAQKRKPSDESWKRITPILID